MDKTIAILWIIILTGSVFIAINLFKPEPTPEIPITTDVSTPNLTTEEKIIIEVPLDDQTSLNYTEHLTTGDKYFEEEYYKNAIEHYQSAVNLNPNSSTPLIKLANAYLANNQPNDALQAFTNASIINPNTKEIQLGIAQSHLNLRDFESAKNIIWKMDSTDYEVKYYVAIILILNNDLEGAKTIFNELITADPQPPENILENSKNFAEKFNIFSAFPETDSLYLNALITKALTEVEQYEASIPLLYNILEEENAYRDAWIMLGYSYLNTDKVMDSIDAFSQAKALDPEKPETLFFLGLAYFANNDIDNAIHYIEKADRAGFEPKEQINIKLGDLYMIQEEYEASAKKYEEVIAKNANYMDIYIRAVWLNIDKLNNPEKALTLAQKSLSNFPDDPMSYNLVGWSLTAMEDYNNAKTYLSKALEIEPNFDAANLNLGWLYEKQGQENLAKEYYKKAYILGQGNSIANVAAEKFNTLNEEDHRVYDETKIGVPRN